MKNMFSKNEKSDDLNSEVSSSLTVPPPPYDQHSDTSSQESYNFKAEDALGNDTRGFLVQYDAYWNAHTRIHVTDTSSDQEVFTVDTKYRKPQVRIQSAAKSGAELATANFHLLKADLDVTLADGQLVKLESGGVMGLKCILSTKFSYVSRARNGERLTWRPRKKLDDLNMVLLNESGIAIARFKPKYKGCKRGGLLELTRECYGSEQMLEEVAVMALTLIHYKESQRMTAAATPAPVVVT